jgi:two-component system, NarL family, nitrate/nitrite response regulator NarL
MSDTTRILLIEDHEIVRVGLRELIDEEPGLKVAAEAATLPEALVALRNGTFDLVILDLALGRDDGSQLLRELPLLGHQPRVLVLSMHDDAVYAQHLIGLGASGFVRKGVDAEEILRAIHGVMKGQIWMSERANTARPAAEATSSAPIGRLTPRERQVLDGVGRGESSKEIAGRLGLSAQTVDVYRFKIRQKLGVEDPGDLRRFAIALGAATTDQDVGL